MATPSTPTGSSVKTSGISPTVPPTSNDFTTPFEAQVTETKSETTASTCLSTSIPEEEPASTKVEAVSSTSGPADPSLTNSLDISITRSTVHPNTTGFTSLLESPSVSSPSPPPSPAAEITKTIVVTNTSADTSLMKKIERDITSGTTHPTRHSFEMSDGSSSPPLSPQTIVETGKITSTSLNINNPAEVSTTVILTTTSYEESRTEYSSSLIESLKCRPSDWGFNVFLDALANEITNEELKRLKLYFIGENGIGYGTLEKIETPLEFFTTLRRRGILTRDNIIYLQAMLWHLKRRDLHKKCVEHARNFGNATYFYAPSPEPENGYRYVKFHVESNELIDFDRRKLENIRTAVAELLLVPPEFVLVCGLEPSSSLIITFMMPEYYASLLIEMVVDYRIPQLLEVGIDTIYYDGKQYDLLGKGNKEDRPDSIRGKLEGREELLERLKRADARLEQRENEVLELSRLLDKAKMDLQKIKEEKDERKFATRPTFRPQGDSLEPFLRRRKESGPYSEEDSEASDECEDDIQKRKSNTIQHQLGHTRTLLRKFTFNLSPHEQVEFHLKTAYGLFGLFFFVYSFICSSFFS